MNKDFRIGLVLFFIVASFAACKKKEYGKLQFQFHHYAPNVSELSWIYAGKDTVAKTAFLENSDYVTASLENVSFIAYANSQIIASVSNPNFAADSRHSVFVCDTLGSIGKVILNDSHDAVPAGKALVRFINLVPDTIGIILAANGSDMFSSKKFRYAPKKYADGFSQFESIDAGTFNFTIKTEIDSVPFNFPLLNSAIIESGKTYNLVATGFPNATPNLDMKLVLEPFKE